MLIAELNLIPDFRESDNICLGITPLFTTYQEIWQAVKRIQAEVAQRLFEKYQARLKQFT